MNPLTLPIITCISTNDNTAVYAIEPLEPGFGYTLGPTLCRALSSFPGLAVTGLRIQGWQPGTVSLPGMHESIEDLVLNCKRVCLRGTKIGKDCPGSLLLEAWGALPLCARDLVVPRSIEIVTPDVHLATLTEENASLSLELLVESGKGYVSADARAEPPPGVIAVDAIFTPVRQVSYTVESVRVGAKVNYQKLVLAMTTDGTISPEDALRRSAAMLARIVTFLAAFDAHLSPPQPVPSGAVPIPPDIDALPMEELGLPLRMYNSLKRSGLNRVGQVLCLSEEYLREIRNFGEQALDHLVARVVALNLLPATSEPAEHDDPSREEVHAN